MKYLRPVGNVLFDDGEEDVVDVGVVSVSVLWYTYNLYTARQDVAGERRLR